MSQDASTGPHEAKLRRVRYFRHHGMWHGDRADPMENSLLAFVYDIPYFGTCGVFPPFHLFNQIMMRGGGQGGMSPGASWEPFSVTPKEYRDLVEAVRAVPPEALGDRARYTQQLPFTFDPAFDGSPDTYPVRGEVKRWERFFPSKHKEQIEWGRAVAAKHRDAWHAAMRRAGFMPSSPPSRTHPPATNEPQSQERGGETP